MSKILITTSSFKVSGAASRARLAQPSIEIVTNSLGRELTETERYAGSPAELPQTVPTAQLGSYAAYARGLASEG